jgi:PAS domain S-box-containing protein
MKKVSILVVEDNYIVMMELVSRLEEMGYQIAGTAASGAEAIEKAGKHMPDLTIMDIRLKGDIDGIEAASAIKKKYDIPVIYLTAHSDEETLSRAKITEPFGYILKPFEEKILHSSIEMALYKHQVEIQAKENKHWLLATLKSIGDALIATDTDGIVKMINPQAAELCGCIPEEAIGKSIDKVFYIKEKNNNANLNPVSESIKLNKVIGASEKILLSAKGKEYLINFSAAPIKREYGIVNGAVLVFRDITEKIKSRELIEQQRIFLRHIIDTDPNYITVKDQNGSFKLINKALAEALGSTADDITGKFDSDYFPPENIISWRKYEKDVINSGKEIFIPEDKFFDKDGKVHFLQTFKSAISNECDTEKLILTVASDVTQLKETESALRKSEEQLKQKADELAELNKKLNYSEGELRTLNASKDKFLSIIAHDLRSPFNALIGLSQFLVEEINTLDKTEILSISEDILASAKSTFSLLENLLQWSRVKNGNIQFDPSLLDIKSVVSKVVNTHRFNASKKNQELIVDLERDLKVYADPNMANVIFSNLVSNAIKFTKNEGRIVISAYQNKRSVEIRVADNGIGMDSDTVTRLFHIGENISKKGTNNEEGAGLGLLLTKEFIEINKGTIRVHSSVGEGSEFIMTFPQIAA